MKWLLSFFLSSIFAGILAGYLIFRFLNPPDFLFEDPISPTRVYDIDNRLISEFFIKYKIYLPESYFPDVLKEAFINMEDKKFYYHNGVDFNGIIRALLVNLFSFKIKMGGSTITQQLAKIFLLDRTGKRERTLYTKLRELFLALQIERFFTKKKILELYLNNLYLAHGAYGVEAASRFYFGKDVYKIDVGEAALLASLTTSPEYYSPIKYPYRSKKRQRLVLMRMATGGIIDYRDIDSILESFWKSHSYASYSPRVNVFSVRRDKAPWFSSYILSKLKHYFDEDVIYGGGLRVYTTLDLDYQMSAREALLRGLRRQDEISKPSKGRIRVNRDVMDAAGIFSYLFSLPKPMRDVIPKYGDIYKAFKENIIDGLLLFSSLFSLNRINRISNLYMKRHIPVSKFIKVEGAIVALDVNTGYIKAMIGGRKFTGYESFNRAVDARRQLGSAFKPFVYGAAFESRDFTPATTVFDSPEISLKLSGKIWMPQNYERTYYGLIRLREALKKSINIVSIRIAEKIGIEHIIDFAARLMRMGEIEKERRFPKDLSIALGTAEFSPLEVASAYAIIANHGREVIPISIRYITDKDGNVILNPEEEIMTKIEEKQKRGFQYIIEPEVADLLVDVMKGVLEPGGTAYYGVRTLAGFTYQAAGKTGTTNRYKDAWFIGFTPNVVAAVWVGFDDRSISLGQGQTGGVVAAPIWGDFMKRIVKRDLPFKEVGHLNRVEVCAYSGLLPSKYCRKTYIEKFIPGTEPTEVCTYCIHKKIWDFEELFKMQDLNKKEDLYKKDIDELNKEKFF